jgi:phosphatidylglycerol lysyltransferase
MTTTWLADQSKIRRGFMLRLLILTVGLHGIFIIATTLLEQLAFRNGNHLPTIDVDIDISLLIGLGIIYLSTLLRRRKRMAWVVALLTYTFMIGLYSGQVVLAFKHGYILEIIRQFAIPVVILGLLWLYRDSFTVKSDIRSFGYSARFSVLVLLIALVYGTAGFSLMDHRDFHREIPITEAIHRTIDQFGLTTSNELVPHTRRAKLFVDSLSVLSVGAVGYAIISLFQPIRARYTAHDAEQHERAEALLAGSKNGRSEDFFKLWPHDKSYFFEHTGKAGLAYKVKNGVALIVADPFGDRKAAPQLFKEFQDVCYSNDWQMAFVHTEPDWNRFYEQQGLSLQKLGEEAVVSIDHFDEHVRQNKYFRQIRNKFAREQITAEVLLPPHDKALVARLTTISDEWLARPGRAERGFMLGYFSPEYLQQSTLIVARDSAGTIQAFVNQIPSFDPKEANFDMLRHADGSLGNINDFVLLAFLDHLKSEGFERLNLGLAPLAGLEDIEDKSVVTTAMRFMYSNGDRFYSFSGLYRFKAKYEPEWSDRYLAYAGGARNFVRIMNALNRAMRVKLPKKQ